MKCDGLTIYDDKWYDKSEADAAIAELKAKLETVNELVKTSKDMYDRTIESLKASHYVDSVDAGMRERRLRRALYKALANWAYATENLAANFLDVYEAKKWAAVYARCIKKAEEYK